MGVLVSSEDLLAVINRQGYTRASRCRITGGEPRIHDPVPLNRFVLKRVV